MKARPRVCVTRRLPKRVEAALRARFEVVQVEGDDGLSEEELSEALRSCDGLLPTVIDPLPASLFGGEPKRCRVIANFGVGVNHIALDAARASGMVVTNTPDVLTADTAELAILLMLAVMRRSSEGERQLRSGSWSGWRPTQMLGRRLTGRTLGIVGLGRIGRAVAATASKGFGMRVLAWTRTPPGPDADLGGVELVRTLDELLGRVDVLSLHCPGSPATRHLIGASQLAMMRPGSILINAARGDVVDEKALVEALDTGRLSGAGLDVYEAEPAVHRGLVDREDVVLLPHLGSATIEAREAMGMRALANLDAFFSTGEPPDRVV